MRLSLSWLKELTGLDIASEKLAHDLTMAGLEVEGVENLNGDTVLELSITPNRSDCLSVLGIAREVAAIYGLDLPLNLPFSPYAELPSEADPSFSVSILIEEPDLCHRYAGAVLRGVKVAPSPSWLSGRLEAVGIRPINNIVDVTNYVCIELGQPLHAFDLAMLRGPEIRVRTAREGEKITTLDGKDRLLSSEMLVIADALAPVAVAGVMGGSESEVTVETQDILLESAWFLPSSVRKTAKKLKLNSEASHRFERGVDEANALNALKRAVTLIKDVVECSDPVFSDVQFVSPERKIVGLRPARLNKILGISLGETEIVEILRRLGIKKSNFTKHDGVLYFDIPGYRADIGQEHDLVEEVARIYGFDHIVSTSPRASIIAAHRTEAEHNTAFFSRIRQSLVGSGFSEAISYSFCSKKDITSLGFEEDDKRNRILPLQNPISDDLAVMRTTLLPNLLGAVKRNLAHSVTDIRLFELGTVFFANDSGKLPDEEKRLCVVWSGHRHPVSWTWKVEKGDYFDLKGTLDSLLAVLKIQQAMDRQGGTDVLLRRELCWNEHGYIPGTALNLLACLKDEEKQLGTIGEISPSVLNAWDIGVPVFAFDLNLDLLASLRKWRSGTPCFKSLPRFPWIERDVAFVVKDHLTSIEIDGFFSANTFRFLESYSIFDIYQGKPVPEGHKSLAIRFRYQALDHTLEEEEIEQVHSELVMAFIAGFNASVRAC